MYVGWSVQSTWLGWTSSEKPFRLYWPCGSGWVFITSITVIHMVTALGLCPLMPFHLQKRPSSRGRRTSIALTSNFAIIFGVDFWLCAPQSLIRLVSADAKILSWPELPFRSFFCHHFYSIDVTVWVLNPFEIFWSGFLDSDIQRKNFS